MSASDPGYVAALEEAQASIDEGGMPVGAAVVSSSGEIIGRGHNMRMQNGSAILHGETSAFESAKHLPYSAFKDSTLYTTLSPYPMYTRTALLFKVKRIVIGENQNMTRREDFLRQQGVEIIVLDDKKSENMMTEFIEKNKAAW